MGEARRRQAARAEAERRFMAGLRVLFGRSGWPGDAGPLAFFRAAPAAQCEAVATLGRLYDLAEAPRDCGGCTACCRMFEAGAAPDEAHIAKPAGTPCRLCVAGRGCSDYARRPAACRAYTCLWRVCGALPEDARPDRCGVILDTGRHPEFMLGAVRVTATRAGVSSLPLAVVRFVASLVAAGVPLASVAPGSRTLGYAFRDDAERARWAGALRVDGRPFVPTKAPPRQPQPR